MESVWPPEADPWSLTTPGDSIARSSTSRVLSGSEAICLVSTSVRTACSLMSMRGDCSVTVTVSFSPPTSSVTGTDSCEAIATRRSARISSAKPVSDAFSV